MSTHFRILANRDHDRSATPPAGVAPLGRAGPAGRARRLRVGMTLLAATVGLAAHTAVSATEFGVRVLDPVGAPIAGAAVCVGMPGNPRQFGARMTDRDGRAHLDVPNVPLVVTVSQSRFSSVRVQEPARDFNLVRDITLREGVPGPRCRGGSSLAARSEAAGPGELVIERIEFPDTGEGGMALRPLVAGAAPTHYRLGRSVAALEDTRWQSFDSEIALGDGNADVPGLFLQLRRRVGGDDAWIETVSPTVAVRLPEG